MVISCSTDSFLKKKHPNQNLIPSPLLRLLLRQNRFSPFCRVLLTNKSTDRRDENMTSASKCDVLFPQLDETWKRNKIAVERR